MNWLAAGYVGTICISILCSLTCIGKVLWETSHVFIALLGHDKSDKVAYGMLCNGAACSLRPLSTKKIHRIR